MNLVALLDRLDDWINPIVVKELRQAVKSRLVIVILMVFLGLMLMVMGWALAYQQTAGNGMEEGWNAGRNVFWALQTILLPTLMLVVPVYAAIRMGSERNDNVDLLYISTLSPGAIISGKFVASLMLALLIFSIFAPFMTFTYLLRGIDLPTIAFILWIDVLAMLGCTIIALFLASIPGPRPLRAFVNFGGFLGIFVIFCWLMAGTWELTHRGNFLNESPEIVLTVIASVTVLILMEGVLLYFYAVAMISPPSSNRILPVRLTLIAFWFLTAVPLFWWAWNGAAMKMGPELLIPIAIWVMFNMFNLCVYFVVCTCERDTWGPRMARTIPSNPLFRAGAFFLYTGAGGGVLLTLALMIGTMTIGLAWYQAYLPGGPVRLEPLEAILELWGVIALYTVCYSLSGTLLRHYFLRDQIRNGYSWVLTALLLGVGSFVPAAIATVVFYDQMRGNHETGWWMLANPFMAVIELVAHGGRWRGGNDLYLMLVWWFTGTWFLLMLALSIFWIGGQVRRFIPFEKKPVMSAEARSKIAATEAPATTESAPVPTPSIDPTSVRSALPVDPTKVTQG